MLVMISMEIIGLNFCRLMIATFGINVCQIFSNLGNLKILKVNMINQDTLLEVPATGPEIQAVRCPVCKSYIAGFIVDDKESEWLEETLAEHHRYAEQGYDIVR